MLTLLATGTAEDVIESCTNLVIFIVLAPIVLIFIGIIIHNITKIPEAIEKDKEHKQDKTLKQQEIEMNKIKIEQMKKENEKK